MIGPKKIPCVSLKAFRLTFNLIFGKALLPLIVLLSNHKTLLMCEYICPTCTLPELLRNFFSSFPLCSRYIIDLVICFGFSVTYFFSFYLFFLSPLLSLFFICHPEFFFPNYDLSIFYWSKLRIFYANSSFVCHTFNIFITPKLDMDNYLI